MLFRTDTITKYKKHLSKEDRLRILQNAIDDLELTQEPISNYYEFGQVLGSGKFGVVREARSIGNKLMIIPFSQPWVQSSSKNHKIG